jgi:large subunit ribosomal protein L19e
MKLDAAKRIAADILGVGISRVWINPAKAGEIEKCFTREDLKKFIASKDIRAKRKKGVSRAIGRARQAKRRTMGPRPGKVRKRIKTKQAWMKKIRALRSLLKKLKEEYEIDDYRKLYLKIKGGEVRDKAHLLAYVKENYQKRR